MRACAQPYTMYICLTEVLASVRSGALAARFQYDHKLDKSGRTHHPGRAKDGIAEPKLVIVNVETHLKRNPYMKGFYYTFNILQHIRHSNDSEAHSRHWAVHFGWESHDFQHEVVRKIELDALGTLHLLYTSHTFLAFRTSKR